MGTRLYVGNLSFSSTSETVREAFARIGEVTDVHIVTDRTSGQSRGFGFVTMGSPAEATKAIESMNGGFRRRGLATGFLRSIGCQMLEWRS
jgi:RNA recognition motif-containing protein